MFQTLESYLATNFNYQALVCPCRLINRPFMVSKGVPKCLRNQEHMQDEAEANYTICSYVEPRQVHRSLKNRASAQPENTESMDLVKLENANRS